ncbi:hypothetical protein BGZ52_007116 [Haplosporangium bisporale]|nr:hypothetical protein BGZ52_007116 [Haplosporangium bisporale]KAI9233613.1 MAG: hypothetical protein BYD32DRAFT_439917 [Podila humilis]KFH70665.1 hypothetical protein MVEG_03515 [Podila verticillata NRRL 6337]
MAMAYLASPAQAIGSSAQYNGTLCTDYVDYEVWLPPGFTVASIEAALASQNVTMAAIGQVPIACFPPLAETLCSSTFPRVVPIAGQPNSANVEFACKSTCQRAVAECSDFLTVFGKQAMIPKCDDPIPFTVSPQIPAGVMYQGDGNCNVVTSKSGAGSAGWSGLKAECDAPFVTDTMEGPNGTSTNEQWCMSGCCLPCPAQYNLYRTGALEKGFKMTDTMRAISMVLSFFLMMTYICLGKTSHPNSLILLFSICVFLFSAVIIFPLYDTKGMQCADLINPSTQKNNIKCAIQGGILVFASVATCAWCTALILNLHLHTVWNSAWVSTKYYTLHFLCWGMAIAVTAAALIMGEIKWEYATLCLISQDKASVMFFYPMAAMIFPAFLLHMATFFHIARITIQTGDSETMSRSTLSAGAAAVISHRRHVLMAVKIQWRAALMAVCAMVSVTFYWLFYFIQLRKINPTELQNHILKFVFCLKTGAEHDSCADDLAPWLPPYGLMIAAEFLVSAIGTVIFIVFFKMELVHEWGEKFSQIGYLISGKRQQKKEQDQFFVI